MVHNSGVPIICCGEIMKEIIPSSTDASVEKHLPVVEVVEEPKKEVKVETPKEEKKTSQEKFNIPEFNEEGNLYELSEEDTINLMQQGDKIEKNRIIELWVKLEDYFDHNLMGKYAITLRKCNPRIVSKNILVL